MKSSRLKVLLDGGERAGPAGRIVRAMSERGMMSAADLARLTGLSRATVSMALAELKSSGLVVERSTPTPPARGVGRPATGLTLNPKAGTCVGLHFGLDDVRLVIADVAHTVLSETRIDLGPDYGPDDVPQLVKRAVADAYEQNGLSLSGLLGAGVAVSAPVSRDGQIARGGILPGWAGVNVRDLLAPAFRCPIYADNESNCAATAELMWGAAMGAPDFVLFKIDLGVGGAVVVDGKVVTGAAGGAGEFGHMAIDPEGGLCRCGNRGCLELVASFVRPLAELSKLRRRRLTMDDAIALAEAGDPEALRLIRRTAEAAGRGLALIGTMLNPPLILIGGRMALAGDILLSPLREAFERDTLIKSKDVDEGMRTSIRTGKFTENDSLLGAVGLVLRSQGRLA